MGIRVAELERVGERMDRGKKNVLDPLRLDGDFLLQLLVVFAVLEHEPALLQRLPNAGSHLVGMTVITVASLIAGMIGSRLAQSLSQRPFFKRRIDATRAKMDPLMARYGIWAFAIASFTPMPFSIMCYVAGIYRVRPRLLAFVLLTRLPRLLVMYWLVRAGWLTGSA